MANLKCQILSAMAQYQAKAGRSATMILLGTDQFEQLCKEAELDPSHTKKYGIAVLEFNGAQIYEIKTPQDQSIVMASHVRRISL